MARVPALEKLRRKLIDRRNELSGYVTGSLAEMSRRNDTGDAVDVATASITTEMSSQLAELEEREIGRIQHALTMMDAGTYGMCESCNAKIPFARLAALPYSTLCVNCQREQELNPGGLREELAAVS